jgi:site-specific recombinase XerD
MIVVASFLATLDSAHTKTEYRRYVLSALAVLGEPADITPPALAAYRERVTSRRELSPATVNLHLNGVRSFLRFCRITGVLQLSSDVVNFTLRGLHAHVRRPYQVLNHVEADRLLAAAADNPRDHLLLALALAAGLRCAELCAIQIRDLSIDEGGEYVLRVVRGKGNKDRVVPIARWLTDEMTRYLLQRGLQIGRTRDEEVYLFQSRGHAAGGRLSTARVRQLIGGYLHMAGIAKRISMHSLRHTAAITWLRAGCTIMQVKNLLGHSKFETTEKYLEHIDLDELREAVNRAPARGLSR